MLIVLPLPIVAISHTSQQLHMSPKLLFGVRMGLDICCSNKQLQISVVSYIKHLLLTQISHTSNNSTKQLSSQGYLSNYGCFHLFFRPSRHTGSTAIPKGKRGCRVPYQRLNALARKGVLWLSFTVFVVVVVVVVVVFVCLFVLWEQVTGLYLIIGG